MGDNLKPKSNLLADAVVKLPFIKQRTAYMNQDERSKHIAAQLLKRRDMARGT